MTNQTIRGYLFILLLIYEHNELNDLRRKDLLEWKYRPMNHVHHSRSFEGYDA